MNRFQELAKALGNLIQNILVKIEESALFERLVLKWESLDPRYQKRYSSFANLFSYLVLMGLFLYPLLSVYSLRVKKENFKELQKEVRALALSPEIIRQPAPPPMGWSPLNIATLDDFEINFENFMATLGVSFESGEFKRSGNSVQILFDEITIRQVFAMLYQLDGWYPALSIKNITVENSKSNKVFLKTNLELEYDSAKAMAFGASGISGGPGASFNNRNTYGAPGANIPNGAGGDNGMSADSRGTMTPPAMYDDEMNSPPGDFNTNPPVPLAPFEDE